MTGLKGIEGQQVLFAFVRVPRTRHEYVAATPQSARNMPQVGGAWG
jgi:hypothetical protein